MSQHYASLWKTLTTSLESVHKVFDNPKILLSDSTRKVKELVQASNSHHKLKATTDSKIKLKKLEQDGNSQHKLTQETEITTLHSKKKLKELDQGGDFHRRLTQRPSTIILESTGKLVVDLGRDKNLQHKFVVSAAMTTIDCRRELMELWRVGKLQKAIKLFEQMPLQNQVCWNTMLAVLLYSNHLEGALRLFIKMPERNPKTYSLIITGLSRFRFVEEAWKVFDSVRVEEHNEFSWTAMISCYTHNNEAMKGLELFRRCYGDMFAVNVMPNGHTFSILLKACSALRSLLIGMQLHGLIIKLTDFGQSKALFIGNSLMFLHAKFGSIGETEKLFNELTRKDLSSWNIMMDAYFRNLMMDRALGIFDFLVDKDIYSWNIIISGFADIGRADEALRYFNRLLKSSEWVLVKPNLSTYTIVITICATLAKHTLGTQVHTQTLKLGMLPSNNYVGNSLISMYSSCGSIRDSEKIFTEMPKSDIVSSNSLIHAFGRNGYSRKALEQAEMALKAREYDYNTFIGILTSCSHGGLVDEGMEYFNSMSNSYGLNPSLEHYNCVIDMLGRAGRVVEAHTFLCKMPLTPNSASWQALLNACMVYSNLTIGELAARELRLLESRNVANYVMMGNIYRGKGLAGNSKRVLDSMCSIGLKKDEGCSWIY